MDILAYEFGKRMSDQTSQGLVNTARVQLVDTTVIDAPIIAVL